MPTKWTGLIYPSVKMKISIYLELLIQLRNVWDSLDDTIGWIIITTYSAGKALWASVQVETSTQLSVIFVLNLH